MIVDGKIDLLTADAVAIDANSRISGNLSISKPGASQLVYDEAMDVTEQSITGKYWTCEHQNIRA